MQYSDKAKALATDLAGGIGVLDTAAGARISDQEGQAVGPIGLGDTSELARIERLIDTSLRLRAAIAKMQAELAKILLKYRQSGARVRRETTCLAHRYRQSHGQCVSAAPYGENSGTLNALR